MEKFFLEKEKILMEMVLGHFHDDTWSFERKSLIVQKERS